MKKLFICVVVIALIATVTAGAVFAGKPDWWKAQELTSDQIAESATKAVPYPFAVVRTGGFLERKNLVERLRRFSAQNKIGYVYLMSFGKFVGYYTIKGKISSTMSQLTNTQQTWEASRDNDTIVDSIGDDGSFGPNEPGAFFFTTNGTMVQTTLDYVYSDQPLSIKVPNLLK
jgi:hypothetical protein